MLNKKQSILISFIIISLCFLNGCVLNQKNISKEDKNNIGQIKSLNVYKNYKDGSPRRAYDKSDDTLIASYEDIDNQSMIQKIYNIIMNESGPFFTDDCDCEMIPYFRLEFIKDDEVIDVYLDSYYFIAIQGKKEVKIGTYYEKSKHGNINEVFDILNLEIY